MGEPADLCYPLIEDQEQIALIDKGDLQEALKWLLRTMRVLSCYIYDEFYSKAYEIGAHAYLSKPSTYAQILNAVKQSMPGHVLVTEKLLTRPVGPLSATEREILRRIAAEQTNKETTKELAISQRTVESHMTSTAYPDERGAFS
jgi:DNA-binding NarL/FixJ family response regulator